MQAVKLLNRRFRTPVHYIVVCLSKDVLQLDAKRQWRWLVDFETSFSSRTRTRDCKRIKYKRQMPSNSCILQGNFYRWEHEDWKKKYPRRVCKPFNSNLLILQCWIAILSGEPEDSQLLNSCIGHAMRIYSLYIKGIQRSWRGWSSSQPFPSVAVREIRGKLDFWGVFPQKDAWNKHCV